MEPNAEFRMKLARRETYIKGLDGVEAFILLFAFAWAIGFIFLPHHHETEPISNALESWLPNVPVRLHGWILATVCIVHALASKWKWPDMRAVCIACETAFFLYAFWAIWLTGQYLLGLFCLPVIILFSSLNFATLLKPMEVTGWVRGLKRGGSH